MFVFFLVIQAQAKLIESMHITFDESNPSSTEKVIVDDNAEEEH